MRDARCVRWCASLALLTLAIGCGRAPETARDTVGRGAADDGGARATTEMPSTRVRAAASPSADRRDELTDPSPAQMVMLYHQLAELPMAVDAWIERDQRVTSARGSERAQQRALVRAELEATASAMRSVGRLRLSLGSAQLSEYDASYGEFTLSALAPSATVPYRAFDTEVGLRFTNAARVQTLAMPSDSAQVLIDALGPYRDPSIDLVLAVSGAVPDRQGGSVQAHVVQYELRAPLGGALLLRRQF